MLELNLKPIDDVSIASKSSLVFPKFSDFPTEIRLKIWRHACQVSRNIDLWVEFRKNEVGSTIWYTQRYNTKLSHSATKPPILLSTTQESRLVSLEHYQMAFEIEESQKIDVETLVTVRYPGFRLNFEWDRIAPRGFFNVVAMDHMFKNVGDHLKSLAIDIRGTFFSDLKSNDWITKHAIWPFPALEEIVLYDSKGVHYFQRDYCCGRVHIDFVDLDEPSTVLETAKADFTAGVFDKLDQMAKEWTRKRPYRDSYGKVYLQESGWVAGALRPQISLMALRSDVAMEL
ncbi:hypothetical protein BJ878DRAFT_545805 [Calycina marina]|uniref:2EXR domain-containing protein n=1 Tax=Calycina marina TaxID=1763456 RepID=A0A9P7YVR5_9HELO|nr:hypothetical protein BJ878DRAFT_545805 [Calycina marina]